MSAPAVVAILVFTLPSTGQHRWVVPEDGADSVHIECDGTDPIHHLQTARLYWWPLTGGMLRLVQEHSVVGREGGADSFTVTQGGHYYVTATNNAGESCASNLAYVPDSTITGVVVPGPVDALVDRKLFDIHGRLVRGPPRASGVFLERVRYASGRQVVRRIVFLK